MEDDPIRAWERAIASILPLSIPGPFDRWPIRLGRPLGFDPRSTEAKKKRPFKGSKAAKRASRRRR